MADEILRSKHAFGSVLGIEDAKTAGKIDAFDILFLTDEDGHRIGWITKDGETVILEPGMPEAEVASKIEAAVTESKAYADEKVDAAVEEKVAEAIDSAVAEVKNSFQAEEYEISYKPEGTIVDYRDKEIRVLCPTETVFNLQNSGAGADPNLYYIGFKAYAPSDEVVSFKEDLAKAIADETMYYFEDNDFAGVDEDGRKYSIAWLPVAKYDEATATWTYYGANSNEDEYIGWYYSVEWYDTDGVMVASDCIRINLTNETCHSAIEPFYMSDALGEVDTKIEQVKTDANAYTDEKIAEIVNAFEIVEF